MPSFDWIVVGNGLTGAALGYELARQGFSVLLLDRSPQPPSATLYSYGGIPHWTGKTDLTRQLCKAGMARHRALLEETGVDTELRELDLLLTVPVGADPVAVAQGYAGVETLPVPLEVAEAVALEPLLNPDAIGGALTVRHGHVNPTALVRAYNEGLQALGGQRVIAPVTGLVRVGDRVTGVLTPSQAYAAGQVAIAAGGDTRALLQTHGLKVPVYFTYAELIETLPLDLTLRTLVMPANLTRSTLEQEATLPETEPHWEKGDLELMAPILDVGVVQFQDGHCRIGQISRIHTNPHPTVDAMESEAKIRHGIEQYVPDLVSVPGQWRGCTVAFSRDGLPLAGPIPGVEGLAVFSGFSGPFILVPGLAEQFARWATGASVSIMAAVAPGR
ncbi:NAD(P)/FAD-dependent oxidoreductase [Leptolyngbya sp. PCC 6406]|uniref:NAD(P)/FAD-dependent oxidoreductase n=1 Tax=Leptolyngbya sp. PCC 6406 TaxID=1173264 RepID=UPI0002ABB3F1|nr:FAD-binding oxidoreductase [Leptolyngbya sp. PCC 6406]